jgi:hypothetical protein
VARVFVAFVRVPFEVDFGTTVESFERNLRLPFTPSGRRFGPSATLDYIVQ